MSKYSEEILESLGEYLEKVFVSLEEMLNPNELNIYDAALHLIKAGGKLLRPLLVLLGCKVVGGEVERVLPVAAGVELAHVASLLHDDIIDHGEKRRGVETVHKKYGSSTAIIAGDLLIVKNFYAIAKNAEVDGVTNDQIVRVLKVSSEAGITLCEGEAMDVEFMESYDVSEEECIEMYTKKTATGFYAPLTMGAILGGGTDAEIEALGRFGTLIGVAFQMRDNYLGLFGEEMKLGKPLSDIVEGKRTLIIVHALQNLKGEERDLLISVLGKRDASTDKIRKIIDVLKLSGSAEYVKKRIEDLIEEAKLEINTLKDTPTKEILLNIADFIRYREI